MLPKQRFRHDISIDSQLIATLIGNWGDVNALMVLPNGHLACASRDSLIRLWNVSTHKSVATLRGHTDVVSALAVLPNGQLASGSNDETIKLWDMLAYQCVATLQGHRSYLYSLTVLSNGQLAGGSSDYTINLWNVSTHKCVTTLTGHRKEVTALMTLPNGQLASGSVDKTIKLWDVSAHACVATLTGHTKDVTALTVLPNGQLASGSEDKTIRVWEISETVGVERSTAGRCLRILNTLYSVCCLELLSDGTLSAGLSFGKIECWDLGLRPVLTARKIRDHVELRKRERTVLVQAHERSITKRLINLWYNVDGTSTWVHHLREHYQKRAILFHALKTSAAVNHTLNFDDYYVNLALTKDIDHVSEETRLFSDTRMALDRGELYERLFEEERTFPINALFSQLDNRNVNTGWVRIIGRAGTGKTTLVQYLAHRWSKKEALWDNRFDAVFQVKLNLIGEEGFWLQGKDAKEHLVALIHAGLGRAPQFSIKNITQFLTHHDDRILILLDGFDEIASRWQEPRVQQLIHYAFTLKNGILTSRPIQFPEEWTAKNPFTQSIENIGLSEENVCEYVKKYFGADNAIALSLISALGRNHTMMRLAQIPVNINALCAIWQENEGQPLLTVTMLYHRVVLAVLRHHAVKKDPNAKKPQLVEESLRRTYEAQLKQLAELAYQAFEAEQTQTLSAELLANFFRDQLNNLIFFREELGFLREAKMESNAQGYVPHYFIHLTYQEYFTALHMVQPLIVPEQESAAEKQARLTLIKKYAEKIRDRRYEDRYRVVWTFLAGLIGISPYRAGADYYWDALLPASDNDHNVEADVIGLHPDTTVLSTYHATLREGLLIAKEVSEPLPARLLPLQHRMQALLQWRIVCEDTVLYSTGNTEMESSADIARQTKRHERRQRQLIYDLAQLGAEPLPRLPWNRVLGSELASPLQSSLDDPMTLPAASLQDLYHPNSRIRYGAVVDLLYRAEFKSITRLTSILQHDPCSLLRATALVALSMQQYSYVGELDFLYAALMDANEDVRRNAALMLGILYNGEEKTILALRTQLQHDSDAWSRIMIAKTLISLVDDKALFKLLAHELQHVDMNVRQEVIVFLKEKAACVTDSETLQLLLDTTINDIALDRAIALRRVPPKTYALLDFNVISNENLAILVESIWYHSACAIIQGDNLSLAEKNITLSQEKKLALQQAQDRFFSQLNTVNEIHEVVLELTKRLDLSLKTRVFENDFTDIPLPQPPVDPLLGLTQKMESLRIEMQSMQAKIQVLNCRDVINEDDVKNLNTLQQTMTQQQEELDAYTVAVEVETKLKQQPLPAPVTEESARYARTFRLMLIRTQLAAAVIGTGLFKTNASTTTGKVGRVLSAFGSSAPLGIGIGIKLISFCCQAADEILVKKRMERLEALGDTSEQVAQLADTMSCRLFECPRIENRVKTHHLSQLFSAVSDVAQAGEEDGFYGVLTSVIESTVDRVMTEPVVEVEERAEQDANLLLAAIAHQGVPMKNGLPDPHRLFLYAIPLLTIVDDVYIRTLMRFTNNLPMHQLDVSPRKKAKFYAALTQAWHERAELVVNAITKKRDEFVENVAEQLSSQGLFYWKENSNTLTGKRHVSWHQIDVLPDTARAVMAATFG